MATTGGTFSYPARSEVDARYRAVRSASRGGVSSAPPHAQRARMRNLTPVLELGDTRYFMFRRRTYGAKPLPYKVGYRLLSEYTKALDIAQALAHGDGDAAMQKEFIDALQAALRLCWQYTRVTGWARRALRRVGALRNPYGDATDKEALDVIDFFSRGRTTSRVQPVYTSPTGQP